MKLSEIYKLQEKLNEASSTPELPDAGYLSIDTHEKTIEVNDGDKSVYLTANNARVLKSLLNKLL